MTNFAEWLRTRCQEANEAPSRDFIELCSWEASTGDLDPELIRMIADETGATPDEIEQAWRRSNTGRAQTEAFIDQNRLTGLDEHMRMQAIGHHMPVDETVPGPEARYGGDA